MKLSAATVVATFWLSMGTLIPSNPAFAASTGSDGIHEYSIGAGSGAFYGIEGQWHNNNMYESSNDYAFSGHISNEMWLLMANGGYVETGLVNSQDLPGPGSCNCVAYQQFWAETSSSGKQVQHLIQNTSPDGTSHVYEVVHSANSSWNIYRDYVAQGTTLLQQSSSATSFQVGLEVNQGALTLYGAPVLDGSSHSDTFNNYTEVLNSRGSWVSPSLGGFVDFPCGIHPSGGCLNGVNYGAGEWSDNKP